MNHRDQRRYDRLPRTKTFGRENIKDFAADSKAAILFGKINQHIKDLDKAKSGQIPARASKETLLDALLLDFKNIARTSRSIARTENGFSSSYRVPEKLSEAALTTHADALLKILEDNNAPIN